MIGKRKTQLEKDQTPEICLAAVKRDSEALTYVKDQTPEICLAAFEQNKESIQFVKDFRKLLVSI